MGGPCGKCHIQYAGTLIAGTGHAGAIGYKNIGAMMQLVPFVQQGSGRILSHAHPAHFMNVETRRLLAVVGVHLYGAGRLQHPVAGQLPLRLHEALLGSDPSLHSKRP